MNEKWKQICDNLAAQITEDFGERCLDFAPTCPTCVLWRMHDDLMEIVKMTEEGEGDEMVFEGRTVGKTMQQTTRLRWYQRMTGERVLQQAWAPLEGGQIEWRDVEG